MTPREFHSLIYNNMCTTDAYQTGMMGDIQISYRYLRQGGAIATAHTDPTIQTILAGHPKDEAVWLYREPSQAELIKLLLVA